MEPGTKKTGRELARARRERLKSLWLMHKSVIEITRELMDGNYFHSESFASNQRQVYRDLAIVKAEMSEEDEVILKTSLSIYIRSCQEMATVGRSLLLRGVPTVDASGRTITPDVTSEIAVAGANLWREAVRQLGLIGAVDANGRQIADMSLSDIFSEVAQQLHNLQVAREQALASGRLADFRPLRAVPNNDEPGDDEA
jgi:hypothetical protein